MPLKLIISSLRDYYFKLDMNTLGNQLNEKNFEVILEIDFSIVY